MYPVNCVSSSAGAQNPSVKQAGTKPERPGPEEMARLRNNSRWMPQNITAP